MNNYRVNFGENNSGQDWVIVNDDVMGGCSKSEMKMHKSSLLFKGEISLQHNGGFASIRSGNQNFNLSLYTAVKIKFRSTGRNFYLRLASSDDKNKKNYKHAFNSKSANREIVELELLNFKEYLKGQSTKVKMTKDKLENIVRIGIMLSDKEQGPFEIELDFIEFS